MDERENWSPKLDVKLSRPPSVATCSSLQMAIEVHGVNGMAMEKRFPVETTPSWGSRFDGARGRRGYDHMGMRLPQLGVQ